MVSASVGMRLGVAMAALNSGMLDLAFLSGGGAMGRLIASFDWTSTSLGRIADWNPSLKTTVSIILRSNVPMCLLWGPDGVLLYNDAFSRFAANRHPSVLGTNVCEGWPEVAEFNRNVIDTVLQGKTLSFQDTEMALDLHGVPETVWMNLDYSPVPDETGLPAGVLAIVVDTTAKVMSERWRDGERDRLRQMFEQAPGFMAVLAGPDHVFEMTNAAYLQLVGHRDVIGLPARRAVPEVEGQGFFELLDQVFQTGEAFVGSALPARLQRRPDAPVEERSLDLVYQPIRNPEGEVVGIFVEGADVTDRMVAQEALRQSEAQFRTFAESMPNHVWTASPDGLLTWFNPRVYSYSGAEVGALDGMAWAAIVHPDDLELAAGRWEDAIVSGVFYETEFRLRRHDGAYRWHIARAVPILGKEDGIAQWIGTNTDIHDQKAAVQKLADSERRLKLSQNAARISALELDIASGTVMGLDGFWDLWGLTPRESVHISVLEDIVLQEDRVVRSNPDTRTNGTAVPNVEYRIRRPDTGEIRWVSRNVDFVHDETGKPVKMFGVMQDITARKSYEARQSMLTHELEHRIKNILAMVSAIASQTLRNTDIDTGRAVFTERLRALATAHDLLNETHWTDASMMQVIGNTVTVFPVQQITIAGPPIALTPKMALSLALAIHELGTNALKYGALSTPNGRVSITWHIAVEGAETLVWTWRESGGPLVGKPSRRGFGSFLVERVLATDFEGEVRLDYSDGGLSCTLTAPVPAQPVVS